jgi:hypothetical protein
MPRFYFHVEDDRTTLDQEGTVLPDLEAVRQEAVCVAGEMLRNGRRQGGLGRKALAYLGY